MVNKGKTTISKEENEYILTFRAPVTWFTLCGASKTLNGQTNSRSGARSETTFTDRCSIGITAVPFACTSLNGGTWSI